LPIVGYRFGGAIGYLLHDFVIIHMQITLSDSLGLFQGLTMRVSQRPFYGRFAAYPGSSKPLRGRCRAC
jgi:hypothetical protein